MKRLKLISILSSLLIVVITQSNLKPSVIPINSLSARNSFQIVSKKELLSINPLDGFRVTLLVSGLSPIGYWDDYPNSLQDLEIGAGSFGDYLYFIDSSVIYRMSINGSNPQPFANVFQAMVMHFAFDGDLFVGTATGKVYRILPSGETSLFAQVDSGIEGMAFDTSAEYGSLLYISEWVDGGNGRISSIDSSGSVSIFAPTGTVGPDPYGLEFCGSPVRLYLADQDGTIYEISNDGSANMLGGVDLASQIQYGETLACSESEGGFGSYLYLAEQGDAPTGRVLRISLDGSVEVFATGFEGFDWWGVTGLKFNPERDALYVTDDEGRSIYAINKICEVPFYWQRDPNGIKDHPLRGGCGPDFDTIGEAGCLLTSATMLFRHYGAFFTKDGIEMTPPNLSDCMNDFACNYNWYKGAVCTGGKATFSEPWGSFSYAKLEEQLNTYNRPVILGMCQPKGDCDMINYQFSHWVLVVGGHGTDPSNYLAWDPWFPCGQNITLYRRSLDWEFSAIAYYQGTPTCEFPTEAPICSEVNAVPLPTSSKSEESTSGFILPNFPQNSDVISGSVMLYRILDDTMIIEAAAESSVGNIIDMLIWSDTTPNTIWQSFSPYIILPYSDRVYAQFRDDLGNVSEVYSDTPNPNAPPAGDNPFLTYLPVINSLQGYSWIDATNGGTIVASGDDTYQYINIPFAFNFYGNFYTGLYVSSNGFISFGNGYSAPTNSCIPSRNNPNNAIYAFWDDLIPNGGGNGNIYVKQADVNTFVIEWHQVKRYGTSDYETFEIITKRDNSIKIQYKKISNVNSATVGIENSNGTLGVQYICNGIGNPLSNESMIFYTTQ